MSPLISVITPVGAKHHQYVREAVGSLLWQTFTDWELMLVNDAPTDLPTFLDPRVRCVDSPNRYIEVGKQQGNRASMARNVGIHQSNGEYLVFLDADDYLLPKALETLLRGQLSHDRAYTYSSHANNGIHLRPPEYSQERYAEFNIHPITALVHRKHALSIGGFDENAPGWEDWTFWLRMAIYGYCGEYYRGPVFVYRDQYSINHYEDVRRGQELMDEVIKPYKDNEGVIHMARCCGGIDRTSVKRAVAVIGDVEMADGYVTLEYTGRMQGTFKLIHPISKREYRVGRNHANRFIRVPPEDLAFFQSRPAEFRTVMPVNEITLPPEPAPVVEYTNDIPYEEMEAVVVPVADEIVDEPVEQVVRRGRRATK